MEMGAPEVALFLTDLAERGHVSASTQNQALCARPLEPLAGVAWAKKAAHLPVVLTQDEVARMLEHLRGVMWLIVVLLYGAGLRLTECLDLQVKDLDFGRRQLTVRSGKGGKDRAVPLPTMAVEVLVRHLDRLAMAIRVLRGSHLPGSTLGVAEPVPASRVGGAEGGGRGGEASRH